MSNSLTIFELPQVPTPVLASSSGQARAEMPHLLAGETQYVLQSVWLYVLWFVWQCVFQYMWLYMWFVWQCVFWWCITLRSVLFCTSLDCPALYCAVSHCSVMYCKALYFSAVIYLIITTAFRAPTLFLEFCIVTDHFTYEAII